MKSLLALVTLIVSTIIASTTSFSVMALDFKPAMYDFEAAEVARQLEVEGALANTVVYCRADVMINGSANKVDCFEKTGVAGLESQVEKAVAQLHYRPASVNGELVAVRFSFRVVVSNEQHGLDVSLVPNLGTMQSQYGSSYVEPQERLDKANWYEFYSKAYDSAGEAFLGEGQSVLKVSALVGTQGDAEEVSVVQAERRFKRHAHAVSSGLRKSEFIPGFVGDRPVKMPYLAIVNF